jgi:multisubunit Na+/H+ antiporter MnhG subunit
MDSKPITIKTLRQFGFIMAFVGIAITIWGLIHHKSYWTGFGVASFLFIIVSLIIPKLLHYPYKIWMKLGEILGWINTRIILGIIFYLVFTPIGLILRLTDKMQIQVNVNKQEQTYRRQSANRENNHIEKPF